MCLMMGCLPGIYYHQQFDPSLYYFIVVWFDGTIFLMFCHVWWLCMAINISVQYNNGELLPDIILLTQDYYPRGTRLNTM